MKKITLTGIIFTAFFHCPSISGICNSTLFYTTWWNHPGMY